MSRPSRTGRATRRRSTRAICRKKPTGAPSSAACGWRGGSSPHPHCSGFVREETLPGLQVQTDDELLDYARRNGGTCYHASCTCLMGTHPMSVVDDELRVHGLDGLRVINAAVMPAVTSTNTNAPTIMIAEKGAAMIKGAARQRLAAKKETTARRGRSGPAGHHHRLLRGRLRAGRRKWSIAAPARYGGR